MLSEHQHAELQTGRIQVGLSCCLGPIAAVGGLDGPRALAGRHSAVPNLVAMRLLAWICCRTLLWSRRVALIKASDRLSQHLFFRDFQRVQRCDYATPVSILTAGR
jgi:hypothetical protein